MASPSSMFNAQIEHLKGVSIFGAASCLVMTVGRLYIRRGRWWWDDYIASFSMSAMIFSTVTLNLHLLYDTWLTHPQSIRVALFYLFNLGFYITMWSFRISVLLAFIRLGIFKPALYLLIFVFGIMCAILGAQAVWICEAQLAWKSMMLPSCSLGKPPAITTICFTVVGDAVLLFTPLFALWKVRTVQFAHRVRLCVTFGSNILVTISCMVHSAYVIEKGGLDLVLVTFLQLTTALIVCNLPIVSAALHRLWSRQTFKFSWKQEKYCAEITFTKINDGDSKRHPSIDDVGVFSTFIDITSGSGESMSPVAFEIPEKPARVFALGRSSSSLNAESDPPFKVLSLTLPPFKFDHSPLLDVEEVLQRGPSTYFAPIKPFSAPSVRSSRTIPVAQQDYLFV